MDDDIRYQTQAAYLVSTNRKKIRPGEAGEIISVQMTSEAGSNLKPHYVVLYPDKQIHFFPLSDNDNFALISKADVETGKIPEFVG